jgi:multicomponent Na+:H+ antiporter subunit C
VNQFLLYALVSVALFCIGFHGLITQPHLLRKLLALNVMGSGVFLFLIAVARRNEGEIPDPVPHALVLTGIVIAVSVTALALGMIRRLHAQTGRTTLVEEEID